MTMVDIISIDSTIKSLLCLPEDEIKMLEYNKTILKKNLLLETNDDIKEIFTNEILILEDKLDDYKKKTSYNIYILESISLLSEYKEILQKPKVFSFMKTQDLDEYKVKKEQINREFLKIANKYMDIKLQSDNNNNIVCENCSVTLDIKSQKNNNIICENCSMEIKVFHSSSFADSNRINISTKYSYNKKNHFRDCINQYTGEQNVTIPNEIYDYIFKQLDFHNINSVNKVYPTIDKKIIYMFLKEGGFAKQYENLNLIYSVISGNKLDDISHLKENLVNDFDKLSEQYDILFSNNNRKNFLNTQYVLFQLLKKYNHNCSQSDFTVLKTLDRKLYHENIVKTLFESLGWNYTSIF